MKHFLILLIATFTIFSCVDDFDLNPLYTDEIVPPTDPDNPDEPTDSLNQEQIESYFNPLKVGNTWIYQSITNGETETITQEVSKSEQSGDTTFYYIKTKETNTEAKTYYNNKAGFGLPSTVTSNNSPVATKGFIKILDENKAVGENWEFEIITEENNTENKNRYVNTVSEKIDLLTLNGVDFEDILLIEQEIFTTQPGTSTEVKLVRAEYYWAKNIGAIKIESFDTILGRMITSQIITDYTLN